MGRYRAPRPRPDALPDEAVAPSPGSDGVTVPPPSLPWRDDGVMLTQLQEAQIVACEQVPQGSNYSFVVGLSLAGTDIDLLAIYKPKRGEVPLWDFPSGTLYQREYAAYLASQALRWPFVPPTVIRDGPYGIGSVQQYVQAQPRSAYYEWRRAHAPELMRMAVFDYITNNADRKAAHCLLDERHQVWGIDHGLTFNVDPKLRTVIRDFSGDPLPEWLLAELQAFAECEQAQQELVHQLRPLLARDEIAAFGARWQRLLKRRVFPHLDHYDSVPREWW